MPEKHMGHSSQIIQAVVSEKMLSKYHALKQNQVLVDVTLKCDDGRTIEAHRTVLAAQLDYFYRMFTSEMGEASQRIVRMKDLSFAILEQIVDFAYTGTICIDPESVCELLLAANYLEVNPMKEHCEKHLLKEINLENCLELLRLADQSHAVELREKTLDFIAENFSSLCFTDQFMQIDCVDSLGKLLSDDHLNQTDEKQIFIFVVKWSKYDLLNRASKFPLLLQHVRFPCLPLWFFYKDVCKCDLVMGCKEAQKKVREIRDALVKIPLCTNFCNATIGEQLGVNELSRSPFTIICLGGEGGALPFIELFDPIRNEWRQPAASSILWNEGLDITCVDKKLFILFYDLKYDQYKFECFDLVSGECFQLASHITGECSQLALHINCRVFSAIVAVKEESLYLIGGLVVWGTPFYGVMRYDIARNEWTEVAKMSACCGEVAAAVYKDQIFVVGGGKGDCPLNYCERYDPASDKWTTIAPMICKRRKCGVAVVGDHLYAMGGEIDVMVPTNRCERYSFAEDKWTEIQPLVEARFGFGTTTVGSRIYVIGGRADYYLNTVEVFDTESGEWALAASLNEPRFAPGVACLSSRAVQHL